MPPPRHLDSFNILPNNSTLPLPNSEERYESYSVRTTFLSPSPPLFPHSKKVVILRGSLNKKSLVQCQDTIANRSTMVTIGPIMNSLKIRRKQSVNHRSSSCEEVINKLSALNYNPLNFVSEYQHAAIRRAIFKGMHHSPERHLIDCDDISQDNLLMTKNALTPIRLSDLYNGLGSAKCQLQLQPRLSQELRTSPKQNLFSASSEVAPVVRSRQLTSREIFSNSLIKEKLQEKLQERPFSESPQIPAIPRSSRAINSFRQSPSIELSQLKNLLMPQQLPWTISISQEKYIQPQQQLKQQWQQPSRKRTPQFNSRRETFIQDDLSAESLPFYEDKIIQKVDQQTLNVATSFQNNIRFRKPSPMPSPEFGGSGSFLDLNFPSHTVDIRQARTYIEDCYTDQQFQYQKIRKSEKGDSFDTFLLQRSLQRNSYSRVANGGTIKLSSNQFNQTSTRGSGEIRIKEGQFQDEKKISVMKQQLIQNKLPNQIS